MQNFAVAGEEGADSPQKSLCESHAGEESSSLTKILRDRLFKFDENGRSKAMDLVDKLVKEALNDNFRALQEILSRIDGHPKTGLAEAVGISETILISASTAQKILEAYHDEFDAQSGD